jgi:hypothetical protein
MVHSIFLMIAVIQQMKYEANSANERNTKNSSPKVGIYGKSCVCLSSN